MKNLNFISKFIIVSFLAIAMTACNGEDGTDGIDGADGMDGNANVATYLFDISTKAGGNFAVDVPQFTQDVIDNDLIVGYVKTLDGTYIPVPTTGYLDSGFGSNFVDISTEIALERFWLYFSVAGTNTPATIGAGNLTTLKVVIAESNSTTIGRLGAESLKVQLENDGVDLNDYHAVMDYFNLKH
ncbi:hypothetical protein WNY78_16815 [Psychroserpens sp. AS72]|uniref:hypothetical protein n=1 Tax=Psychroserpens sp. AS72 TaxID=3135775 RepID=UPI003174D235